ncbi:L-lactate dehydrogenase complex protein LldG [Kineosphaera limosa]|uniref:LUD domain-containing protein n=1 Tax=Kineosphaera limosa NBRC 100340 TaxID=1184609 RepID=K6WQ27_9MICO|nr:LUD domain-containing protein [Kineosphaera limosa]NYE02785.1 L-lactate dehydrogenase complex protein LldG [Kineosphaera limosa]GAB94217.1 hypothetical protein KILIM_004_00060 [Kineosphaera limosa NBRC 100340]
MSTQTSAGSSASSAKDEILARIRHALVDVPDASVEQDTPIAWEYGRATREGNVLEVFIDRVVDYKAELVRCAPEEVPAKVVAGLQAHGVRSVVLPAGIDGSWREAIEAAGIEVRGDEPRLSRAQLDETDGVVTACAVGSAETGTIMLDHGPDQGRRALSLVPDVHVCVIRADQVVSDVPEAVARTAAALRAGQPSTWISGGSATSDIELSRVEGVHGPRTLHVVLAE